MKTRRPPIVCIKCIAVSRASSNSQEKNIGSVFELSSVAFRLAPPHGGLFVFKLYFCNVDRSAKLNDNNIFE